jgi:hypothetical protein
MRAFGEITTGRLSPRGFKENAHPEKDLFVMQERPNPIGH